MAVLCNIGNTIVCTVCTACSSNTFQCASSGLCIPTCQLCDGYSQCGDNSDEHNCHGVSSKQRRNSRRGRGSDPPLFGEEIGTDPLTFCDHLVPKYYKSKTRCLPEVYSESMQDCSGVSSSQNVYKLTTEQSVFARHCHGTAATALISI